MSEQNLEGTEQPAASVPRIKTGPWMGGGNLTRLTPSRPTPAPAPQPSGPDLVTAAGHLIVPDFYAGAPAMRAAMDAHFLNPFGHTPDTHQVWNYWHVPDMYTYMRTLPAKVIGQPMLDAFMAHLTEWARVTLRCIPSHAYLSLYVGGCRQELHNDALNGSYGYVYSLTRWRERHFTGGETLILKPDAMARTMEGGVPMAGPAFYDAIPTEFNQLLVFDDRLPHAVRQVTGPMDPIQGRLVIHGHMHRL